MAAAPATTLSSTWITYWREVDQLHQLADTWNALRTGKHWQRAPPDGAAGQAQPDGSPAAVDASIEEMAWLASLPDDPAAFQVQIVLGGSEVSFGAWNGASTAGLVDKLSV